jgi:hypothetical protein
LSSIRSLRVVAGRGSGTLRPARAVLLAAVAIFATALLAGPAHASLSAAGPVNPATAFPDWYQDPSGLKLQLCLDGLPMCSAAGSDLAAPDGEAFWWRAQGDVAIGGGTAKMALAQEAAFVNNDGISFGRIRVVITGARANTSYSVAHPYGTMTIATDGLGNGKSTTDIGCGAAPCDWNAALGTAVGPFLHWDPTVAPAPQPGYIGDAATPHRVVGSPVGFNAFQVTGGGDTATTDQLTVEGKLAGPPVPVSSNPDAVDFGATAPGVPVTRSVPITSFGVPDAGGASNLTFGAIGISGPAAAAYSVVGNTCSGRVLPSGAACSLLVQFTPGAPGAAGASLDVAENTATGAIHVALAGSGAAAAAPGASVAGAGARSRLTVRKLRTTHRMSRARVVRRGLRLTMRLPEGTEIVKIAVFRVRKGKVVRKPVWLGYRVPSHVGLYRLRLDSRALRRALKAGLYQVNVTPGVSKRQLGTTTTTRVRITRR